MKGSIPRAIRGVSRVEIQFPRTQSDLPGAGVRPRLEPPATPRPVGIDRGMSVPACFFEPLADELLDEFEGDNAPA